VKHEAKSEKQTINKAVDHKGDNLPVQQYKFYTLGYNSSVKDPGNSSI